jgi:hypothetical protein
MFRYVLSALLLILTLADACPRPLSPPKDLDLSSTRSTVHDKYRVALRPLSEPIPRPASPTRTPFAASNAATMRTPESEDRSPG